MGLPGRGVGAVFICHCQHSPFIAFFWAQDFKSEIVVGRLDFQPHQSAVFVLARTPDMA